jgi:multidrug efflux system outer membrane protein
MRLFALALVLGLATPLHATTRLSLADAIALARCRRSDMVQADIDVQLSQLNVLRAKLERVRLTITTSFNEQYEQLNINAPPALCDSFGEACNTANEAHEFNAAAALVVPVWSGFSVEADLARAKALRRAAGADREAKQRALVREVIGAYWAVRRAELLLALGRAGLRRTQEIASLVKARADHGIVSLVDYNRAQTMVLGERTQLTGIEERVEAARTQLAAVLQVNDEIELTDEPLVQGAPMPRLEDVLAQAQAGRPEIKLAQASLEAAQHQERSVKGQLWPQVSLFANANIGNTAFGLPQPNMIGNVTAGVSVNWTIFDMLTTWNNVREAQYLRDRAAQDRIRINYTVGAEARTAWFRLKKAIERRESILRALTLAESTVDLIRKRYLTGTSLLIEVLSAEAELLQLESEAAENGVEIADARAELAHASGQ